MTAFLHTLLNMSLTASFVAVIVFLLRLILKGRAARQTVCLLWLLVFARLLIPVTLQSPVSLVPDLELSDPAPVVSTQPEAVPTLPGNTSPVQGGVTDPIPVASFPVQAPVTAPPVVTLPPVSDPMPEVSAPVAEPPVTEEPAPFPWETVLTVVWAVGVAAMLTYGLGSYLSIRRKLRFAIRSREGFWEDPHLRSPFILGLVRPKIYLPCHMTPYARRFILCHEQAHISRGDHIVKPICWLALAIHWFNPLAWAAFLLLSRDIEVACDEKVLRELGQEVKADYSATLLALATNGRFPAPTPLAFGEGDAKTRIKSVLNFKKPALWVTVAAIVVAIVAAVCLLTDPVDKFDPDDYTTLDCYPGLYFTERYSEDTAITVTMAYRLEKGKPVLVAGWQDHPADNVSTLIYPTPNREDFTSSTPILGPVRETTARYEQYLVDYMMAQDEGWAQRYIEETGDLFTVLAVSSSDLQSSGQIGDLGAFQGGIAYTPEENLLFCWEGTAQVLPRWTSLSPDAHTVKVYPYDLTEDGTDRLDILWTGKDITLLTSSQPGLQTYTDDALITYLWDGKTWTAHNAVDTIAFTDKPVSFDAEARIITVTYDPNAHTNGNPDIAHIDPGMIPRQFSIPEELGQIERVYVGEAARIARREDGDYDLTYGVYAVPEGGDPVRVVELTAILKWNALTEEFEITFTGAEAVGGSSAAPEESQLLAELPEYGLSLYRQSGSWRPILQYGEHLMELNTAIEIERSPVRFFPGDRNNDGITEIVILYHKGWGTGSNKYGLMACWADGDGLHVEEHEFADLMEEFNQNNSFEYDREGNALSLTYHGQTHRISLDDFLSSLNWDAPDTGVRVTGEVVGYSSNGDGTFTLSLTPGIYDGYPMLNYLRAELRAAVRFDGERFHTGEAGLTNLSAAVIGSLPGEDVSLFTNGEGAFWLAAYGHYGPVTILNDLAKSLDTDTLADLRKATADNLSGPDFEYISFTMRNKHSTVPHTYDLIWSEESGSWEQFPYTSPLSSLPRDIVTNETYPTDREWYYKVADSQNYSLYARNWGEEVMLTYGNFFWKFDHVAHTGHMNLPVMEELDDETVAVISEVNTGTGVKVDELVVYDATLPVATDYLYDWRDLAADLNRNNTLTYDKLSNSLTLSWNGKTYSSGRLVSDLSVGFDLEDGFTGALIANGDLIRFSSNGDGTFTVRMSTAIGRGNKGAFSDYQAGWFWQRADDDSYVYPLSTGITGLDLVWTVKFTGEGFEVVTGPAITTKEASHPAPDFLTGEQQTLYCQAMSAYTALFGASPAETFTRYSGKTATVDGKQYYIMDQFADWAEFEAGIHSLFTSRFWQERNNGAFVNHNGKAAVLDASRGGGNYYNGNFADEFELVSSTDNEIVFHLIGHYTQIWPIEGMTGEERDEYRRTTCEYIYKFPIRMVKTADGWRFDQFHSAAIDEKAPDDPGITVVSERPAVWITAEDVFLAALNDELEFTQYPPNRGEPVTSTLSDFLSSQGPLHISAMTLADMDRDGTRELLLDIVTPSIRIGTEILRYDPTTGTLTGYFLWVRAMWDINVDGTFEFSGSSVDSGIARLSFTENGYTVEKLIYTEGSNTTNEVYFYAHGQSVTEAAYQKARDAHLGQTEPVVWLDYTPENVEQLLVPG